MSTNKPDIRQVLYTFRCPGGSVFAFDPLHGAPLWAHIELRAARGIVILLGWLFGNDDLWLDSSGNVCVKVDSEEYNNQMIRFAQT